MSIVVQKAFWKTSVLTGVVLAVFVLVFSFLVPNDNEISARLSGVVGWSLVLSGITLLIALLLFLKDRRSEAGGVLFGVVIALVLLAIIGSIFGLTLLF